jgi:hypothetical protein
MSRRHHGGRPHRQNGHARGAAPLASAQASPRHVPAPPQAIEAPAPPATDGPGQEASEPVVAPDHGAANGPTAGPTASFHRPDGQRGPANGREAPGPTTSPATALASAGCTAPQLRRFIKSRPYVPMHELRRRFGINGSEDDVTRVEIDGTNVFVGLPPREGGLLGELLRGGEVGYELSLDPRSPVVVGLYPMRPVPRT